MTENKARINKKIRVSNPNIQNNESISLSKDGLNSPQIELSRKIYGTNKMTKKKCKSLPLSFVENLNDPVIRILIASLIINTIFTINNINWVELAGMGVAILLASAISTLSEYSSRTAFEKLNNVSKAQIKVRRNGTVTVISSDEIVVGDVILLSAGDKICADGVLIFGSVSIDQSALTGESTEINKIPSKSYNTNQDLSPASSFSCLRGSLVSSGEGEMMVLCVGDSTFLGKIAGELQINPRQSPLKLRLTKLASQISKLGYVAAILIALTSLISSIVIESNFVREIILSKITNTQFWAKEILHSTTLALTVIIMAVPEGLPMMIAVVLSSNIKRMLKDNVLVRKQMGIEAAGSMNVLFTDKTGTLTNGKMSVESFITENGQIINGILELKRAFPKTFTSFCENAKYNTSATISKQQVLGGNATERALLEACKRYTNKLVAKAREKSPFDSNKKYSSAIVENKIYIKGAPEVLAEKIDESSYKKYEVEYAMSEAQKRGKRVIYLCEGESEDTSFQNLRFVCAAIISDPLRKEAKQSVLSLKEAGIDVVMITGDNLLTAKSIAEQSGIINSKRDLCLEHSQLMKMTDDELSCAFNRLALVSRALPSDKSRLVRIAQQKDLVVGMTGDGINDAPALRLCDVGFAMGDGVEVAKEAGDIVILDNNLASIVKAVLYGRNIFKSIRKFLVFQLTMNFSSALVCMLAPILGFESPITVTQMLWVNMIMDTLGGLAFAGEEAHKRIMKEKPKRRDEPILNSYMANQIFISGSFSVLVSLLFLKDKTFTSHFRESENNLVLLSAFFALFIFLSVVQCINSRTDRLNLFNGISKNPTFVAILVLICIIQISFVYFGGKVLRTTPLLVGELSFTLLCALSAIPFEFLRKVAWRFSGHSNGF